MLNKVSRKQLGIAARRDSGYNISTHVPQARCGFPEPSSPPLGRSSSSRFLLLGALLAYFDSTREEPEPLAWQILESRLGLAEESESAIEAEDRPTEEFAPVTSVIEPADNDRTTDDRLLFASSTPPRQGIITFAGSLLAHALAAAVLCFALAYKPPSARVITERYSLRELDLEMNAELEQVRAPHPDPLNAPVPNKPRLTAPAPSHSIKTPVQRLQPLIQPDLPNPVKMAEQIPVPRLVVWSASKTVVQKITPPAIKRPAAPDVIPTLDRPNQELRLSDVAISSSNQLALKSHVIPSTTAPVTDRNAVQVQQPLSSVSQISAAPAPAAILSLSDMQIEKGPAMLPPVSGAPKSAASSGLAPGDGKNASIQNGNGSANAQNGGDTLSDLTVTPLSLSQNGHFSAVIVGDDLAEEYPELSDLWGGRAIYTVYLRVGLPKSWILQYSLPRDAKPAAAGAVTKLEAPWAYTIVRPNLAPGSINADALMIHGFINSSGKFEDLKVSFPQPFPIGQFVLKALQQWQFRPATRDGQAARVEVVLIIPDQDE